MSKVEPISSAPKGNSPFARGAPARFATTRWSLVLAAALPESESRGALEQLCVKYWYPLYAFVRGQGQSHDQAQELTQSFFLFLLEKKTFEKADPNRGRFRTFLISSMKNFMANQWRSEQAMKRGGGTTILSIEFEQGETQFELEPIDRMTPEKIYQRRWAMTLLNKSVVELEQSYIDEGKHELFQSLKPFLTGGESDAAQSQIAEKFEMSAGAVRVALHRMRKRCQQLLREEIAQTVDSPDDIDDELREMITALSET
jgi:RNA polymerase sigma factor (sigma-70 family)